MTTMHKGTTDFDKVARGMQKRLLHLAVALQLILDSQVMGESGKVSLSREEAQAWQDRVDAIGADLDKLCELR